MGSLPARTIGTPCAGSFGRFVTSTNVPTAGTTVAGRESRPLSESAFRGGIDPSGLALLEPRTRPGRDTGIDGLPISNRRSSMLREPGSMPRRFA